MPISRRALAALARAVAIVGVVAWAGGSAVAATGDVIDRVLAVAEGEIITLSDVRVARGLGRVDVGAAADPVGAALELLIERALILAGAERLVPPEPAPAAVDAALAGLVAAAGSRASFEARLARLDVDEPFVRQLLREDLRIRAYLDQRFTAETPDEQRHLVATWVAGLRRRADVVNLYEQVSAAPRSTAAPARD